MNRATRSLKYRFWVSSLISKEMKHKLTRINQILGCFDRQKKIEKSSE